MLDSGTLEVADPTASSSDATDTIVDEHSDEGTQLLLKHLSGDPDAFVQLVELVQGRAENMLRKMHVCSEDEISDLVQDAWAKVLDAIDTFDRTRRFRQWFNRIIVNIALDNLRRNKRRPPPLLMSQNKGVEEGSALDIGVEARHPCEQAPIQMEVQALLDRIPEQYRAVLWEMDALGASTSEVAKELDREEATIRWRLGEARSMFALLLAQQGPGSLPRVSSHAGRNRRSASHLSDRPRAAPRGRPSQAKRVPALGPSHLDIAHES